MNSWSATGVRYQIALVAGHCRPGYYPGIALAAVAAFAGIVAAGVALAGVGIHRVDFLDIEITAHCVGRHRLGPRRVAYMCPVGRVLRRCHVPAASSAARPASALRLELALLLLLWHPILLGGWWSMPLLHLGPLLNLHSSSHVHGRLMPHLLGLHLHWKVLLCKFRLLTSTPHRQKIRRCPPTWFPPMGFWRVALDWWPGTTFIHDMLLCWLLTA